ncbi:alpha/beta fold hydrolase [Candidatus Woesearchaeota archaeon]|nr:alpha/beta fold hydrolase [Candidatus Woesearchaeota archaeon]
MQEQKSFWKRHEFVIIAAITILLVYLLVAFNQKINFLLGNELIVHLTPQQKSFQMHYGEIGRAYFDVSIDNAAYCSAKCSYSFNDNSRNEVVDKGDFEIVKEQHFAKSYDLSVKRLGSGQDIYSFEVKCRSIRSFFCLTKGAEKSKSSLVTVSYDLTEAEKELKKMLKKNVTGLLELLAEADVLHRQLNQKYFELAHKVNLRNLSKQKIEIDDAYDKMRISIENLRSIWSIEDYVKLNQLFNESFFENLNNIKNSITALDREINSTTELHNSLLLKLNLLSNNLNELKGFAGLLEDNEISAKFDRNIRNLSDINSSVAGNSFDSYGNLIEAAENITNEQNFIIEKSRMPAASYFFRQRYFLKFENDLSCSLRQDCKDNISIKSTVESTENFIRKYPDSALLSQSCNSLKELNQSHSSDAKEALKAIADKNTAFPSDNEFLALADNFRDNLIRKINNSYLDSFEKTISENKTSLSAIKIANSTLPINKTDLMLVNEQTLNISLYLLSKISISNETLELLDKCPKIDLTTLVGAFNLEPIRANISYSIVSKIDTNLSDNPPICCVFNECGQCCRDDSCKNDPKTFPIIFLHGHSFAKDNSPEFSLEAFNKLQSKLQDDGYINAGIVSLYSQNEQLQKGVWGMSGKPVAVKASYYYDAFRKEDKYIAVPTKSENIDTYAVRLKDIIDIIKERTGKPRVNIIAHSMGGLVARRYMQIFGGEDVDKLILITAPNKGISGAISDYCGFIGENRECQDMQESSLFINKLNDPLKQPDNSRLYAVIGQGCKMKLGDGDGIVLSKNAKLENAKSYYVNGTCGGFFGGVLHTEILDIEKHPETYRIVAEILKE